MSYELLSRLQSAHPETVIYRKFLLPSFRRFLHMQAKILRLQLEVEVTTSDDVSKPSQPDANAWTATNSPELEAWLDKLSDLLSDYHFALLQTKQVMSLPSPPASDLKFLRDWVDKERGPARFLKGVESDAYRADHTSDLIVLTEAETNDPIAQFLRDKILPWYHHHIGSKQKPTVSVDEEGLGPVWKYSMRFFFLCGDVVCSILSSFLPILSIVLLYYIHGTAKRLMLAAIMSLVFSFVMSAVIRGRRADVFAATTALAAVQVVFICGVSVAGG